MRETKEINKRWREFFKSLQKAVTLEIWQDVNGGKTEGVAKQEVDFLKTVAGIWRDVTSLKAAKSSAWAV